MHTHSDAWWIFIPINAENVNMKQTYTTLKVYFNRYMWLSQKIKWQDIKLNIYHVQFCIYEFWIILFSHLLMMYLLQKATMPFIYTTNKILNCCHAITFATLKHFLNIKCSHKILGTHNHHNRYLVNLAQPISATRTNVARQLTRSGK